MIHQLPRSQVHPCGRGSHHKCSLCERTSDLTLELNLNVICRRMFKRKPKKTKIQLVQLLLLGIHKCDSVCVIYAHMFHKCMCTYVCVYIYIYTWNPNDPCFDWKRPRFQKNRGQTGSRYVLYTNIILSFLSALVPGVCLPSDFSCQKKAELGRKTRGLTGGGGVKDNVGHHP